MTDIFLKLIPNTQKDYENFTWTYHFYLKERHLKYPKSLLVIYMTKMNLKKKIDKIEMK